MKKNTRKPKPKSRGLSFGVSKYDKYLDACSQGPLILVRELVNDGAHRDIDGLNEGLLGACRGGHRRIAEYMIAMGANDFNRGLREASAYGKLPMVEFMIAMGANDFRFGLMAARDRGYLAIIELLMTETARMAILAEEARIAETARMARMAVQVPLMIGTDNVMPTIDATSEDFCVVCMDAPRIRLLNCNTRAHHYACDGCITRLFRLPNEYTSGRAKNRDCPTCGEDREGIEVIRHNQGQRTALYFGKTKY